ncbi:MAG TPA: drug/metabolite exporter YedA [Polyangiaceae bacterium]|nr:drug/metabolite exporter YedA [Polyangiaceae bacterium]
MVPPRRAWLAPFCLATLYTVWGSTYLAQRVAIEGFAPLRMAGLRFVVAGSLLYAVVRRRGAPAPSLAQWRGAAASALPLLVTGMGVAACALKRIPSGLGALLFASVPLWTSVFDRLWGGRLRRAEIAGLALGFAGVALVSSRGNLGQDPLGAALMLAGAASYALGCVATRRLALPEGALGTAAQMLVAGPALLAASFALGEPPQAPTPRSLFAMAYLVAFGTLLAYTAFGYLLRNARPALATSYAFVNPVVALALGAGLAGERLASADLVGLALVLGAVALVAFAARRPDAPPRAGAAPTAGRAAPART